MTSQVDMAVLLADCCLQLLLPPMQARVMEKWLLLRPVSEISEMSLELLGTLKPSRQALSPVWGLHEAPRGYRWQLGQQPDGVRTQQTVFKTIIWSLKGTQDSSFEKVSKGVI